MVFTVMTTGIWHDIATMEQSDWFEFVSSSSATFLNLWLQKTQQMYAEEKTNESAFEKVQYYGPYIAKRFFVDQAAADEWVTFIEEQAAINNWNVTYTTSPV